MNTTWDTIAVITSWTLLIWVIVVQHKRIRNLEAGLRHMMSVEGDAGE